MTNSFYLGQVIGLYLIVMAVYLFVRREKMAELRQNLQHEPVLLVLSGGIALILGLLIVLAHNVWVFGWPVIITLLGYLLIVVGLVRLFFPEKALALFDKMNKGPGLVMAAAVMLILGLWLTIAAFGWV
ncbi:MAG: hypothetical protein KDK48_04035 [Chlamydiia bacterium]|nr:hypothetical protein [Chlamydiia bacterium]